MPKFDVVVGNPPYNKGIGRNTPYEEWGDKSKNGSVVFLKLASDIIKRNGEILFVQPPTVLLAENAYKTRNHILNNCKIKEIDRQGYNDFENVHQLTCILSIKKAKDNNNNIKIIRKHFGNTYISHTSPIGDKKVIPFYIDDLGKNIFYKFLNKIEKYGYLKQIKANNIKLDENQGKYKIIRRLFKKGSTWAKKHNASSLNKELDAEIFYSNEKKAGVGVPKVFHSSFSRPVQRGIKTIYIDENGEYGSLDASIECKNKIQAKNVALLLNDDISSFILYAVKHNMHTRQEMLKYIPYPPHDEEFVSSNDIYKWLNLNDKEIFFLKEFMSKGDYIN